MKQTEMLVVSLTVFRAKLENLNPSLFLRVAREEIEKNLVIFLVCLVPFRV